MQHPRIAAAGDSALVAAFPPALDADTLGCAMALADSVRSAALQGVRDVVVTIHAVTVYFDPLVADRSAVRALLTGPLPRAVDFTRTRTPLVVPVRYGGEDGPDLAEVAAECRCTPEDVVERHTAVTYRVFAMGFVPGFAYLGPVDERIRVPRRATPRIEVPAGSVGIAGAQTGIYPVDVPGGWRLIGRTDVRPFDLQRTEPFLLDVGDLVRFEAV
jgi:KipI family sensor histidine kinase inhibitor